jgi:hypothetical protein
MGVGERNKPIPTLRTLRAEQVPSALCLDATPERDAAPGVARVLIVCFCRWSLVTPH